MSGLRIEGNKKAPASIAEAIMQSLA